MISNMSTLSSLQTSSTSHHSLASSQSTHTLTSQSGITSHQSHSHHSRTGTSQHSTRGIFDSTIYEAFLPGLKSEKRPIQLKTAKELYATLLNELKHLRRDQESIFIDSYISHIKRFSQDHAKLSERQACIFYVTSLISIDSLNMRLSKLHQTSLMLLLRSLMSFNDRHLVQMSAKAMGKFVQSGGVECDSEFKTALENLRNESRRYNGIVTLRELAQASPSRLYLNSPMFFEDIVIAMCDKSIQIRTEACELFRLSLKISISRESSTSSPSDYQSSHNTTRRTSITSQSSLTSNSHESLQSSTNTSSTKHQSQEQPFNDLFFVKQYGCCFENSVRELDKEIASLQTASNKAMPRDDKIHGYLLIILEILKFSERNLAFEKDIEKYLSTYYYRSQGDTRVKTREELHSRNLSNMLPHTIEASHTANPFTFLFNWESEKITVDMESKNCSQLIADRYDVILSCIERLYNASRNGIFIQHTLLQMLPRLANFNRTKFAQNHLAKCMSYLQSLLSRKSGSSMPTELLYAIGFLSLALGDDLQPYCEPFIELIRSCSLLQPQNNQSSTSNRNKKSSSTSNNPPPSQSALLSQVTSTSSMLNSAANALLSQRLTSILPNSSTSSISTTASVASAAATTTANTILSSPSSSTPTLSSPSPNQPLYNPLQRISTETSDEFNAIVACIAMLSRAMPHEMHELLLKLLEPLMLLSGGVNATIRACLDEICQSVPQLKASIHENLLKMLSQILTNRPLCHLIQSVASSASHLMSPPSLSSLDLSPADMPSELTNTELTINALQTLRCFDFNPIYVIVFLRYSIDVYLQNDTHKELRIESVLTASHLLTRLIDGALKAHESRSLISLISSSLHKLLTSAISDYEPDTRYYVLHSLTGASFQMFLSLPDHLNILFLCTRDLSFEIRELAAWMLSRLTHANSAHTQPFIRKFLMDLLQETQLVSEVSLKEQSVRLMGHLLSHTPRLVNLYMKPLTECLHTNLRLHRDDLRFTTSSLTVIGQLAAQSSPDSLEHFEAIIPLLIELLQDAFYVQRRHTSLWALGQIIANTGYVIEPYKRYPSLLPTLLDLLMKESNTSMRRETMRILGLLGALDPFEYKQHLTQSQYDSEQSTPQAPDSDSQSKTKSKEPNEMLAAVNMNTTGLDDYYPALAIHLIMKFIKNAVGNAQRKDGLQALILAMRSLDNRCVNYVDMVIPALLELIETVNLNDTFVIELIGQLSNLVLYIRRSVEPYVNSILDVVTHYWHASERHAMIIALVELVQSVLNVLEIDFKKYMNRLVPLVVSQMRRELHEYSQTNPFASIHRLAVLIRSATPCIEPYVSLIVPACCEYIRSPIISDTLKQEILFTVYHLSRNITLIEHCSMLFHAFTVALERHLESNSNISIETPSPSSNSLLTTSISLQQLTSSPQSSLPSTLRPQGVTQSSDISLLILETLYQIGVKQMGSKFTPYIAMFDRCIRKSTSINPTPSKALLSHLRQMSRYLTEAAFASRRHSFISDTNEAAHSHDSPDSTTASSSHHRQRRTNNTSTTAHNLSTSLHEISEQISPGGGGGGGSSREASEKPLARMAAFQRETRVDFNNIRACIDRYEHIASHEGWRESFRRFMTTMVEETPSPTLRVCIHIQDQVQADLFNACFISIWLKISEKEQNELIKYLELALRLSDVPEIIKTILNLAEFMERCDTIIPIDYKILAEKAFQVRAYAKALHYVEELFSASTPTPTSDTLELLIILNHELGKDEAASGVLEYANKHLKTCFDMRIRERWYEKLHQWQKSLSSYEKELNSMEVKMAQNPNTTSLSIDLQSLSNAKLDLLLGKMRCLRGMAMWNELRDACRDLFEHLSSITPTESSLNDADTSLSRLVTTPFTILISPAHQAASMGSSTRLQRRQTSLSILSNVTMASASIDQQQLHLSAHEHALYKTRVAEMGAVACWGLAAWDDMAKYAQHVPEKSYDGSLYRSVLAINHDEYPESLRHIAKARDLLDSDLTSMASQSYERAYQAIISTQVLAELEEVIKFKEEPEKRETLREAWWKRLDSCEKTTENWHRLLLVRSLVLAKERDVRPWLKFATMCQKEGNLKLTGQILRSLLSECGGVDSRPNPSQYELEECKYAALKYEWVLNANNNNSEPKLAIIGRLSRLIASNEALDVQLAHIGVNPREVQRKREQISALLAKCYLKKGEWIEAESPNGRHMAEIIECFARAKTYDPAWYKAWNAWSYANYDALLKSTHDLTPSYTKSAVNGFFRCINLAFASSHLHENNCLQDTLKLLTIWFNYAHSDDIAQCVLEGINNTPMDIWLQVIPQLIARIDTPKAHVGRLIQKVLIDCGRVHPQALVYRLILASKCPPVNMHQTAAASMVPLTHQTARNLAAQKVLDSLREHYNVLVEHAKMVSEELIRVAILWHELWHESIEEASRLCFGEKNIPAMLETLDRLHAMMERGATTGNEIAFIQLYGREFSEAKEFCDRYRVSMREADLEKAWQIYFQIFKKITKQLPNMLSLELNFVSPKLMASRALELAVPGTYEPSKPLVTIASFHPSIQVISSKQRPRKIAIFGSNGRKYVFLLKGHEDMRQDERVMQIFGLVNNLLVKNQETARRDLAIQRYSVIPLSQNSGLLEWLLNCDTLHSLIKEYRDRKRIALNLEHRIIQKAAPDYEHLTAIQKVEIFESAINNEFGDDLAKILWHKSATAEKWLERRTNYTRSLAVMSMVGYVLGLGDRHPSNLMLDRTNGKIIHVDFGDCFETAMTREKFPEKIPFRLTRMLKNAMEVTGIEGTFRLTCEAVMRVLRTNRESVMAVLEAFVYDPLVYWKLFENNQQQQANRQNNVNNNNLQMMVNGQEDSDRHANNSVSTINSENGSYQLSGGGGAGAGDVAAVIGAAATVTLMGTDDNGEEQNHKALSVLKRVKDKLTGFDFGDKVVNEKEQVEFLIRQATSAENLCQCFIGWCAWW